MYSTARTESSLDGIGSGMGGQRDVVTLRQELRDLQTAYQKTSLDMRDVLYTVEGLKAADPTHDLRRQLEEERAAREALSERVAHMNSSVMHCADAVAEARSEMQMAFSRIQQTESRTQEVLDDTARFRNSMAELDSQLQMANSKTSSMFKGMANTFNEKDAQLRHMLDSYLTKGEVESKLAVIRDTTYTRQELDHRAEAAREGLETMKATFERLRTTVYSRQEVDRTLESTRTSLRHEFERLRQEVDIRFNDATVRLDDTYTKVESDRSLHTALHHYATKEEVMTRLEIDDLAEGLRAKMAADRTHMESHLTRGLGQVYTKAEMESLFAGLRGAVYSKMELDGIIESVRSSFYTKQESEYMLQHQLRMVYSKEEMDEMLERLRMQVVHEVGSRLSAEVMATLRKELSEMRTANTEMRARHEASLQELEDRLSSEMGVARQLEVRLAHELQQFALKHDSFAGQLADCLARLVATEQLSRTLRQDEDSLEQRVKKLEHRSEGNVYNHWRLTEYEKAEEPKVPQTDPIIRQFDYSWEKAKASASTSGLASDDQDRDLWRYRRSPYKEL